MCGIAGYFAFGPTADPLPVERLTAIYVSMGITPPTDALFGDPLGLLGGSLFKLGLFLPQQRHLLLPRLEPLAIELLRLTDGK